MYRTIAVALALVAGISLAVASENQPITSVEQCQSIAKTLEENFASSQDTVQAKQLEEADMSIKALNKSCEDGDLTAAAEHATAARQSLASEN